LRSKHSLFSYFGDVEIAKLNNSSLGEEQVGTLNVSVANFKIVKGLQASYHLDKEMPNLLLGEQLLFALFCSDNLKNVTSVGMFHYDAEAVGCIFKEGLLVPYDVWVVDAG
jgi:hypothetical protein